MSTRTRPPNIDRSVRSPFAKKSLNDLDLLHPDFWGFPTFCDGINIVVNGDAELILVMESSGGQCRLARRGSLQSRDVRDQACAMMEGGREALEKRYRRIIGGDDHV